GPGGAGAGARRARRPDDAQAERGVGRAAPAPRDRPRARERAVDPVGGRADREPRLRHRRGDHAAVRGAARRGANHRAGHARSRHRGACLSPDPPARRACRARRADQSPIMKRRLQTARSAALVIGAAACQNAQTAPLDKARAQLETATGQLKRSEALYQSKAISETEYESSKLAHAIAQAAVVNAGAGLQTANDAMDDTQVRAPIAGSILYLQALLGTV